MNGKGIAVLLVLVAMSVTAVASSGATKGSRGAFQYVESRMFDAVKYDGATRTLTLLFDSGAAYAYHDVPREVYLDFTRIVNKGEYFNRRIRRIYRQERLDTYPSAWCFRD